MSETATATREFRSTGHLVERWEEWGVWMRSGGMDYMPAQTEERNSGARPSEGVHSDPTLGRVALLESIQAHRVLLADQVYHDQTEAVRKVIWLRHVGGLSIESGGSPGILETLGITEQAYRNRYHRAIQALRLEVIGRALLRRQADKKDPAEAGQLE